MTDRSAAIEDFLTASGWNGAIRRPLAGDASFRRYDRVQLEARRAVLMDAPPGREDVRPFVRVAKLLRAWGLSAPEILAQDPDGGFLLLEDLGDESFTKLLAEGGDERSLYRAALDVLLALRDRAPPGDVARYDDKRLLDEALLRDD